MFGFATTVRSAMGLGLLRNPSSMSNSSTSRPSTPSANEPMRSPKFLPPTPSRQPSVMVTTESSPWPGFDVDSKGEKSEVAHIEVADPAPAPAPVTTEPAPAAEDKVETAPVTEEETKSVPATEGETESVTAIESQPEPSVASSVNDAETEPQPRPASIEMPSPAYVSPSVNTPAHINDDVIRSLKENMAVAIRKKDDDCKRAIELATRALRMQVRQLDGELFEQKKKQDDLVKSLKEAMEDTIRTKDKEHQLALDSNSRELLSQVDQVKLEMSEEKERHEETVVTMKQDFEVTLRTKDEESKRAIESETAPLRLQVDTLRVDLWEQKRVYEQEAQSLKTEMEDAIRAKTAECEALELEACELRSQVDTLLNKFDNRTATHFEEKTNLRAQIRRASLEVEDNCFRIQAMEERLREARTVSEDLKQRLAGGEPIGPIGAHSAMLGSFVDRLLGLSPMARLGVVSSDLPRVCFNPLTYNSA